MKNIRAVDITFALDDYLSVKEKGVMIMIVAKIPKWDWECEIDLWLIQKESKIWKSAFLKIIIHLISRWYLPEETIQEKLILSV